MAQKVDLIMIQKMLRQLEDNFHHYHSSKNCAALRTYIYEIEQQIIVMDFSKQKVEAALRQIVKN